MTITANLVEIFSSIQGEGPFARGDPNQSLLLLQAFLGASAGMTLVLTALVAERRETLQQLEGRVEERTRDLRTAVTRLQDAQEALLRPGEKAKWKGQDQFMLTLGNAGGVKAELNGKPQKPFGPSGKVARDILLKR